MSDSFGEIWDALVRLRREVAASAASSASPPWAEPPHIEVADGNHPASAPPRRITIVPPGGCAPDAGTANDTLIACDDIASFRTLRQGWLDSEALGLLLIYLPLCFAPLWARQLGRALAFGHLAQTLDGKIACSNGDSKWIGGPGNLVHAHRMRALADAVLIGAQTLTADQPSLNVRHVSGPDPVRVVLGTALDVAPLVARAPSRILVAGSLAAGTAGADVLDLERGTDGRFTSAAILESLYRQGLTSVYVEGGAYTLNRFIEDGALDVIQVHIAPLIVGDGRAAFPRASAECIAKAQKLDALHYQTVDDGVMLVGRCNAPRDGSEKPATARALWHEAAGRSSLRSEPLRRLPNGWCEIETAFSGVSPGTERLIAAGRVPEALRQSMRCAHMGGDFGFPLKYGYSLVGKIVAGPDDLLGHAAHVFHPHQDRVQVRREELHLVPDAVPLARATLAPNLETALNAVWDGRLQIGQRVLVVGFGTVGSLVARVIDTMVGVDLIVVDADPAKCALAESMGFRVAREAIAPNSVDVAFHTSASSAGLQTALDAVGFEGLVVELSWYGDRPLTLDLGGAFHSLRKRIISSQVGAVAQPVRDQWSHGKRMELVMKMLADPVFDSHISQTLAFADLPGLFNDGLGHANSTLSILVSY